MLEDLKNLQSTDLSPHIGKTCRLECGETVIETVLDDVKERPRARRPKAEPDERTPFTLFLRGAPDCPWEGGTFTLKIEGMPAIDGVYANRVMNTGAEPASLFQAIFS